MLNKIKSLFVKDKNVDLSYIVMRTPSFVMCSFHDLIITLEDDTYLFFNYSKERHVVLVTNERVKRLISYLIPGDQFLLSENILLDYDCDTYGKIMNYQDIKVQVSENID